MSALLILVAGAVRGQVTQTNTQFPNPGFEKWSRHGSASFDGNDTTQKWVPFNWHTFDEASCSLWVGCGSARSNHHNSVNYNNGTMQQFGGTGTNSTKYIGIKCTSVLNIKANGALSTGQTEVGSMSATNAANYNYTNPNQSSNFSTSGKLSWVFVGCPDSMSFYYYTSMANSAVQPLFKVFLHESGEFRDRADGSLYGGNNVRLIASSVDTFSQSSTWKREAWPFKYTKPGNNSNDSYTFIGQTDRPTHSTYGYYTSLNRPSYMLASFSTDKKAGNSNQTSGDLLFIDELWCIYDKGLSSLTIAGTDNPSALNLFNLAEGLTHEPVRTYDNNGNPIFDNSGTATWMYPTAISCNNIPQVVATPKSKLISEFTITQASAENGYKATIYVKHNDNSTFHYYIQFTPELPTITLNQADGMYTACAGNDITVTASGAASYSWSDNLGNNATIHPTASGTYTVTGTAANGCAGTATATVTVNQHSTGIDEQTAYEEFTWINGVTYYESTNEPTFTIENGAANGCDSIVTLHLTINQPEQESQTIVLNTGTTWVSFNMDITLADLKDALTAAAPNTTIKISGQSNSTTYNPNNHRWSGNLAWDLSKMYKITVTADCEITLEGTPINPADHPVTIVNGNNYLGFPLNENMSLTNAFAGFAANGDKIYSQTGSATYSRGRWQGSTLTELQPGKGYTYKSASSESRTFVFPNIAR